MNDAPYLSVNISDMTPKDVGLLVTPVFVMATDPQTLTGEKALREALTRANAEMRRLAAERNTLGQCLVFTSGELDTVMKFHLAKDADGLAAHLERGLAAKAAYEQSRRANH